MYKAVVISRTKDNKFFGVFFFLFYTRTAFWIAWEGFFIWESLRLFLQSHTYHHIRHYRLLKDNHKVSASWFGDHISEKLSYWSIHALSPILSTIVKYIAKWRQLHKNAAILNNSWRQHPTKQQLHGHLPPITKTIQVRRTGHAGHCWGSRDELISDVVLWTPSHSREKVGRPAWTYIQQLCEDTGCNPEDVPEVMNDREGWRERIRDISFIIIKLCCNHGFLWLSLSLSLSIDRSTPISIRHSSWQIL